MSSMCRWRPPRGRLRRRRVHRRCEAHEGGEVEGGGEAGVGGGLRLRGGEEVTERLLVVVGGAEGRRTAAWSRAGAVAGGEEAAV